MTRSRQYARARARSRAASVAGRRSGTGARDPGWALPAPGGAPGTRYIPDALAAIGDPSVVPALVKPLRSCRFDYRFHVAHALGILGGPAAEEALQDLAARDPFPAVREEAAEALKQLSGKR